MSDLVLSYIRTYVPIGVGAALSWLAVKYGIVVDEQISTELTVGLTAVVVAGYYSLVRALETRWPWFGKLLGSSKKPAYAEVRR
jgi:hypothetical protein